MPCVSAGSIHHGLSPPWGCSNLRAVTMKGAELLIQLEWCKSQAAKDGFGRQTWCRSTAQLLLFTSNSQTVPCATGSLLHMIAIQSAGLDISSRIFGTGSMFYCNKRWLESRFLPPSHPHPPVTYSSINVSHLWQISDFWICLHAGKTVFSLHAATETSCFWHHHAHPTDKECLWLLPLTRQKGRKGKHTAYYFTCCNKTKVSTKIFTDIWIKIFW